MELQIYREPSFYPSPSKKPASESVELAILLSNAQVLIKSGENDLAAGILRKALYLDSHNVRALRMMLECLRTDQSAERLKILNAIVNQEKNFQTLFDLAEAHYLAQDYQSALACYFQAAIFESHDEQKLFELYKNVGNILLTEKDIEGAEEYYHKAFLVRPKSDVLIVNLGTLAIQLNDFDQALIRFREAIEINSKNDKAWVGLALSHHHLGDTSLALANIQTAIDLNPTNRTALQLFANWSLKENNLGPAATAIENYLALVDFDEEMSLVLIHLFCTTGDMQKASLEVERFLLWNPNHTEVNEVERQIRRMYVA